MTQNNNIPQGYKKTEIGIIPQEWEVTTLGKLGKVISGLTYSPDDILDTGILVLRSSNIQNGMLCMADNVYVNTVSYNPVKTGDILICVRNGSKNLIGKSAYITPHYDGVAFGAFMSIYRSANNNYLKHLFNSDIFYKNVHRNLGATINSINGNDLKKFVIPIPPLAEQRKIAEMLSVWDEAIEKQSRLIERLEVRKRALMQRLLTGRTRLGGFTTPWQKIKLGEIATIKKGVQVNKDSLLEVGAYPTINGGIEPSGYSNAYNTNENTITISEGGNSCGYVNFITTKFWCGGHCYSVEPNCLVMKLYLFQLLKYNEPAIMALRVGSGLPNIQIKPLMNFWCDIPSLPEQKAIAAVLTAADNEIATHHKKLDAIRLQKRGLMQQLLTGKTRVKI